MAAQLTQTFESPNKRMIPQPGLSYNELLSSPHWEAKRELILLRDGNRCRHCGNNERLQVHHRQYHINKYGERVRPWHYANRYLITLCDECHRIGHEHYKVPVIKIR